MRNPYAALEKAIGHRFRNRRLLAAALTHPSAGQQDKPFADYERLEFLGDAALGLVAAEFLYRRDPAMREGEMTRIRSTLISARTLKKVARRLGLPDFLELGGPEKSALKLGRTSILADALEALFGAVYLDSGLRAVKKVFERIIVPELERATAPPPVLNPKGALQELLQKQHRGLPEYRVVAVEGPDHEPHYTVEVALDGRVVARGRARTKKRAESLAAAAALRRLQSHQRAPGPDGPRGT